MSPEPASEAVRSFMQRLPRSGTKPELALRRELFSAGYRYRVNFKVPGMPRRTIDIAFPGRRIAVFIDGCFWHGCPEHGSAPKNNAEWWAAKLAANRERDDQTSRHLNDQGWLVIRLWEHESTTMMFATVKEAVTEGRDGGR